MKFIKSETLTKHFLNVLILFKDALIIFMKYYSYCFVGWLFLLVAKSPKKILEVVVTYEYCLATLVIIAMILVPLFCTLLSASSPSDIPNRLKKSFYECFNKRVAVVLYGILPLSHAYSNGMNSFNHFSFEFIVLNYVRLLIVLFLIKFLIISVKEKFLGYLFYATPSNGLKQIENAFAPYAIHSIDSVKESGIKKINQPFVQGTVNLKVNFLLTEVSRKFVKTPEGDYHFVNSNYILVLFTLHKITLFFKGIRKAIKYKSTEAIFSVIENEGKVMTSKQRLIYELVLLALVVVLVNAFYVWLSFGSLWEV